MGVYEPRMVEFQLASEEAVWMTSHNAPRKGAADGSFHRANARALELPFSLKPFDSFRKIIGAFECIWPLDRACARSVNDFHTSIALHFCSRSDARTPIRIACPPLPQGTVKQSFLGLGVPSLKNSFSKW